MTIEARTKQLIFDIRNKIQETEEAIKTLQEEHVQLDRECEELKTEADLQFGREGE